MTIDSLDDIFAGSLLIIICTICIAWYIFVEIGVFRVARTSPTFIIFFSQGIGDIGFILNSLWLGVDIIVGPAILIQNSKIYSIAINIFNRPVLYYFALIAATEFFSVRFPNAFQLFFTRKNSIRVCLGVWFFACLETFFIHVHFPVEFLFYGSHVQFRLLWGLISDPVRAEFISLLYNWYVPADLVRGGGAMVTEFVLGVSEPQRREVWFASKNFTFYLSTPLPAYFNALNVTIGVGTFLLYAASISVLRKKSARNSNEGKLLVFCLINNVTIFIPTLMRAIMKTSTKWQLLTVQIIWTLGFEFSAVTLPICSSDLRMAMFPKWKIRAQQLSQRLSIISDRATLPASFRKPSIAAVFKVNYDSSNVN